MSTKAGGKPPILKVIGIESPGSSAEMLGTRRLIISLPETVPGRKDWCYWNSPNVELLPDWPDDFLHAYFAGEQTIELPDNKPYRAFRLRTDFLVKLADRPEVNAGNALSHLPSHLVDGYRYDPGLEAIYKIFDDESAADRERGEWAGFVDGIMIGVLSGETDWERFDIVLSCLMSVANSVHAPEARKRWLALRLAKCKIREPNRFDTELKLFIDPAYPEGNLERANILAEAQRFESEIRAHWTN